MTEGWDEVTAAWRRRVEQLAALAAGPAEAVILEAADAAPKTAEAPDAPLTGAQRAALSELCALAEHAEDQLRQRSAAIAGELGELEDRRRAAHGYASDGRA